MFCNGRNFCDLRRWGKEYKKNFSWKSFVNFKILKRVLKCLLRCFELFIFLFGYGDGFFKIKYFIYFIGIYKVGFLVRIGS